MAQRLVTSAQMLARACFVVLLVLGVLFWLGVAEGLRGVHIAAGVLLVLALWAVAASCLARRVGSIPAAAALLWGAVTVVFGLTQESLLPGPAHWAVQVAHLMVGIIAIGLVEMLAARFGRDASAA